MKDTHTQNTEYISKLLNKNITRDQAKIFMYKNMYGGTPLPHLLITEEKENSNGEETETTS